MTPTKVIVSPAGAVTAYAIPDGSTEDDVIAAMLAGMPGCAAVPAWVPNAILAANLPPPGAVIPVAELYRRLAPAYLALLAKPADVQGRWWPLIGFSDSLLSVFTVVDLRDPFIVGLGGMAMSDGLLTADERTAVLSTGGA